MLRYLIIFMFLFISISSVALAMDDVQLLAKLQGQYSRNLTKVPFYLKFDFYKKFNKDWQLSDYAERKYFLLNYEKNLMAQERRDREEARDAAEEEKERLDEKNEELRKLRDRLKAEAARAKAEKKEDEERQKQFNLDIKEQERILQDMERQAAQGNT